MAPTQAQQSQQVSSQRAQRTVASGVFGVSMNSLRTVAFSLLVDRALSA
jgi:hypothetical protein